MSLATFVMYHPRSHRIPMLRESPAGIGNFKWFIHCGTKQGRTGSVAQCAQWCCVLSIYDDEFCPHPNTEHGCVR